MFNQLVTRHCCPEVQRSFNYMVQGWLPLKGSRQVEKGVQNGVKTDTKSEIFQAAARGVRRGVFFQNCPNYELQSGVSWGHPEMWSILCLTQVWSVRMCLRQCLEGQNVSQTVSGGSKCVSDRVWRVRMCPGRLKLTKTGRKCQNWVENVKI